ncbi:hypothetical protein ACIPWL_11220 [Streptomyces sp. NPDC090023]|uniref:hypothetical protein n=1 Tax=unclassified Streptomyces TaxID=2593676 RepID=UPI0038254F08
MDLTAEDLQFALIAAVADVRTCTEFDAAGMPGYMFWSRSNRYLRERLTPAGWTLASRNHILRTVHPSGRFAITATSGAGGVGVPDAFVSTKNPKGPATAAMVERNEQLSLFGVHAVPRNEPDEVSTWYLLYKNDPSGLVAELSHPVKMNAGYVDTWDERIFFQIPPMDGPGFDLSKLDDPGDDEGPDVVVEFTG